MKKGYIVNSIGAIYYTNDVDNTLAWFNEFFGWGGGVFTRDEEGHGLLGSVGDIPAKTNRMGFRLAKGEPSQQVVFSLSVDDIEVFHQYIKENGWNKITDIKNAPWGGKTFDVTTIDGSIITIVG